ncbi:hypothetical protein [Streptomyces rapamycinicus]|uniref:Uncharacterized protein n=2 Tax=Streptomyces rapamycinicus TaxID=1226757 RepID=A0A0A0NI68_STRRN|nr:hypothetical protein [Streptomyces rapamycinicus]AGP59262.1 hypothetical protein M271_39385 [Streptomyces rapamycinicus NRRL 5491]MBB4787012.1 hypothetical protein [Streptomyces rapamycinicus]RLV77540.1 hypothetical protein D3C57_104185 [Streptomyces rapamycinicus NRRL 5491]UTO68347.1 hypothetical protein LJB45_35025 [Streptomyces rapamycinicus]UTP37634.1 hypothetical protein LIV37_40160 [Streptomyces rapamycinicus NRRL 5491]
MEELAALAASGTTSLVGLMVSGSWNHARERVGRFFARDIYLSGRELADKLARGMEHIHAWRIQALTRDVSAGEAGR